MGHCPLGKQLFPVCVGKVFYRTFRVALSSGKHLENILLMWLLQLRAGVRQGWDVDLLTLQ